MPIGIVHVEVPLSPGGVLAIGIKSFLFEISPECIDVSHMEDHSSPTIRDTALF